MKFYDDYILPHMINCACGLKPINKQREKVVPRAQGRVLEIGMGSGLNLRHYNASKVDMVWGLEPSEGMRRKAKPAIEKSDIEVDWLRLGSEKIPLEDNSADTVMLTYTLCTIANGSAALAEMRRVLKPEGRLLFCEHGEAPDQRVRKWQQRVNPIWKRVFGGCHLDKQIPDMIRSANFDIKELEQMYVPGPKIAAYNYWGMATL